MPQNKFAIARYRIIDRLLRQRPYVKSSEIARVCSANTGFRVSIRTIQLDIEAMKHDDFLGIYAPIEYNTKMKAFYYSSRYELPELMRCFTQQEVEAVQSVFDAFRGQISEQECHLIQNTIVKINYLKNI